MVSASITVMSAVTVRRGCSLREAVTTTVSSWEVCARCACCACCTCAWAWQASSEAARSEEHTSELQSPCNLVCRLLLEKKKRKVKRNSRRKRNLTRKQDDSVYVIVDE